MSKVGSDKRRRIASYKKGFEAGHAAALSAAEPVAYLRLGEPEFVQNVPFGAMWISDKNDPRSFPVFTAPQVQNDNAVKLDGPELWEIVFGIATDAAHEITDEQYSAIAKAINEIFIVGPAKHLTEAAASTAKVETTAPASLFPSSGGEVTLTPTDQTSFHDSAKTSESGHDPQPDSLNLNCQFVTVKVVSDVDISKPVPLRLKLDIENPNLWATPDGRRVFNSEEWALKCMEMDTPEYKEASQKRMEASRLVNAEVVEDYDGWVTKTGDDDDYASEVAELLEKHADRLAWGGMAVEDIPANLPAWAFCCREDTFDFDIEDAIRNYVADNHYEDAADHIKDWKGLGEFWETWIKKQRDLRSYFMDVKRIVVIDRERYEAELATATDYLRALAASEDAK